MYKCTNCGAQSAAQNEEKERDAAFTDEELEFIALEMYASLANGAEHPLFEATYQKAKALRLSLAAGRKEPT
jgi:hypothetical protein